MASTEVTRYRQHCETIAANTGELRAAVPMGSGVDVEVIIRAALAQIVESPKLQACSRASVMRAISEACAEGLVPGIGRDGWLVPFKGECTWMVGYGGLLKLVRRHPNVRDCWANAIYKGDDYDYQQGDSPKLSHSPNIERDADTPLIAAYFVIDIEGAQYKHIEVTPRFEIDKIRAAAKVKNGGKDSPAWMYWGDQQAIKSAIRRGSKTAPLSTSFHTLLEAQMRTEGETYEVTPIAMPRRLSDPAPEAGPESPPPVKEPAPEVEPPPLEVVQADAIAPELDEQGDPLPMSAKFITRWVTHEVMRMKIRALWQDKTVDDIERLLDAEGYVCTAESLERLRARAEEAK